MKRRTRRRGKSRSLRRLVRTALRRWGTDEGWAATLQLQSQGQPQTLAAAKALSRSPSWRRRALGLLVASQLRSSRHACIGKDGTYALMETQALLLVGLHDTHEEVVRAAISGLGHRPHPSAAGMLVRLATHSRGAVRWEVAVALGHYDEPESVEALIRLAQDRDDPVRDWATFGLGSMLEVDTPDVRELLWRNLSDPDRDVRGEAVVGLATRGDPRAIDHLKTCLGPDTRVYELDAAQKLADASLLPMLEALAAEVSGADAQGYWFNCLQDAIDACRSASA